MGNNHFARVWLLAIVGLAAAACGRSPEGAPSSDVTGEPVERPGAEAGPYDIIELPLSDVPEPPAETIYHPEFQGPASGAFVQVLRALEDPRAIPLERWLYFRLPGEEAILHPNAQSWRDRFEGEGYHPLAVYVRVRAPSHRQVRDPFFRAEIDEDAERGWPPLAVADPGPELGLPCAPLEYAAGRGPYAAPDTGARVDPLAHAPPRPWYEAQDQWIPPGQSREGWMLCLSADPAEEARLLWRAGLEGAEDDQTMTAWEGLDRLAAGEWHLLPDMTVLAWNVEEEQELQRLGPAPPGTAATPTGAVPAEGAETVYEGPLWISVGIGMSHRREAAEDGWVEPLSSDYSGVPAPGDCPGVAVWYRHQEPFQVVCQAASEGRFGRFFLQFAFPGMEELEESWDRMALAQTIGFDLHVQGDLDGTLATFQGVRIESAFTWLRADLPDGVSKVWLSAGQVEGESTPVWEVQLYDAAFGSASTVGICETRSCFSLDELTLDATDRDLLRLKMPVPVMEPGEAAHGITIRNAWTTDQTILVNDNLHGQDFLPQRRSDPWLIVEISTVTDRAGDLYLVYPAGDGSYAVQPTELVALYQGGGEIATRYGVHAEVRGAEEGFALLGTLPSGVRLEDVYLVLGNTGPAWRLR